jgi:tetratricopeptide (TPR) repeat protein
MMPKDPRTVIQQGLAAQKAGLFSEAADCYTTILKADPTYFDALQLLGILRFREGKLAEGLDLLERALRITATHGPTLNNYGNVLRQMGRHQEALRAYRAALKYLPAPNALLLRNLGSVLLEIGDQEEAGRHLEHSSRLDPRDPVLWCWIGMLESMRKRTDAADRAYLEAQRLDVARGDAWFQAQLGLAANANAARQYGVAEQQFAMILEMRPTVLARITRLQLAQRLVRWARWQHDMAQLHIEAKETPADHEALMQVLYLTDDLSVLRSCTEAVARFHAQRTGFLSVPTARRRARPRVGYLSGDMRNHVVAWLFAEILEQRDRERFEVFVYALGTTDDSEVRQRICAEADHFVEIGTPSFGAIYAQIVADEIDILVDVAGYTEHGRPRVLAMRPAPVQVGWLGYPGSMGGTMIDYLIADAVVVPPELVSSYSEQIVRLPNSCLPNHSRRRVAAPLSREQLGLPANAIVLCAFVPAMKITPPMFALWMHVMTERPNSCLWLQQPSEEAQINLRREALNAGVDGARLIFAGMEPDLADHLARYLVADIALDTFPYGSHSTAADALWVGCPLISRLGKSFAARVSSSALTAAGLPELVADTDESYRQLILQLIDDAPRRAVLRARLIENRDRSPLFDAAVYARHLEAAFAHMQTQALAGHTPASFDLPLA